MKTYIGTILLMLTLFLGTLSYIRANPSEIGIERHSFIKAAKYIIENDGGTVKAFDGQTGELAYSGTDADLVIQSAINSADNQGGGIIFIKSGTYEIDSQLSSMTNIVFLRGEGPSTKLKGLGSGMETFEPINFDKIEVIGLQYAVDDWGWWAWYDLTVYPGLTTQDFYLTNLFSSSYDWVFVSLPNIGKIVINTRTGAHAEIGNNDIGEFINTNTSARDHIYFGSSDWYIETAIVPKDEQTFEGAGWGTRLIIKNNGINGFVYHTNGDTLEYPTFRNFQIRGMRRSAPYYGLSAFNFTQPVSDCLWSRLWIHRVSQYGIRTKGGWTCSIEKCPIENTGVGSIYLEAGTEGGHIMHNNIQGHNFCNVSNIRWHHNKFAPQSSIYPSLEFGGGSDNCVVDHNNFATQLGACEGHINIHEGSSDLWIDNNSFNGGSGSGINFTGATENVTIKDNFFDTYSLGTIDYGGYSHTSLRVEGNSGSYVTENSGVALNCVNGTWVNHGLLGTPDIVTLTIKGPSYVNSTCCLIAPTLIASNSTHFQIGFYKSNNGTITAVTSTNQRDINWHCEHHP